MEANFLRLIPVFPLSTSGSLLPHTPPFLPSGASNIGFYNLVGVEQMLALA